MADESTTALAVYTPKPVDVVVGKRYPYLVANQITEARVEKIYQTPDGVVMLVLTVWSPTDFNSKQTATVDINQFKMSLLKGGIDKITIA